MYKRQVVGVGNAHKYFMLSQILIAKRLAVWRLSLIHIFSLNDGYGYAEAYGCDLTYDYVKINGDYRT